MRNLEVATDLTHVRDRLLMMGGAAEKAIVLATRALIERDAELAERVVAEDDAVDKMELEIDALCADILARGALERPAASDLRFVLSAVRIAPVVERIADHAVNIAKRALALSNEPQMETPVDVSRLARIVQEMVVDSLDAFTAGDTEKARATIARDDDVDALHDIFYGQVVGAMRHNPATVGRGAEWLFVLKHYERIADYATNVCEQTVYMAGGQVIKHTIW